MFNTTCIKIWGSTIGSSLYSKVYCSDLLTCVFSLYHEMEFSCQTKQNHILKKRNYKSTSMRTKTTKLHSFSLFVLFWRGGGGHKQTSQQNIFILHKPFLIVLVNNIELCNTEVFYILASLSSCCPLQKCYKINSTWINLYFWNGASLYDEMCIMVLFLRILHRFKPHEQRSDVMF